MTPSIMTVDREETNRRSAAQVVEGPCKRSASQAARPSRVGPDHSETRCIRRCTGQPVSAILKKTQGERLSLIGERNRSMAADDTRNLLLERLGLIQRIGEGRLHPLRGHPVIEWTITDLGLTALLELRSPKGPNQSVERLPQEPWPELPCGAGNVDGDRSEIGAVTMISSD